MNKLSFIFFADSPYRTPINSAILRLGEKGTLQTLKTRWWKEKGGGLCEKDDTESASSGELGMANVGGVFLVLMLGCVASLIIAIVEFLWNVRDVAVREKVRFPFIQSLYFLYRLKLKF